MNTTFTVGQVLIALAIILGTIAVGYLIVIFSRIATTVKNINTILDINKENINHTMNSLPGIIENVNEITGSIKQKTEIIDGFFSEKEGEESSSVLSSLETIISSITSILEIFSEIKGFFGNKKKRIFKVKK